MTHDIPWFELDGDVVVRDSAVMTQYNCHPTRKNLSFWVLTILQSGKRTLLLDGEEIRIGPNEFFLLPPYSIQEPCETDSHTACFIHFWMSGSRTEPPTHVDASNLLLPCVGVLPDAINCWAYAQYFANLFLSPYMNQSFLSLQLRALLSIISIECQNKQMFQNRNSLSEQVLSFIQHNACVPLRAQAYENYFGMSYHHLNQIFKSQYGHTVKQYHFTIRMKRAAQMLANGESVYETSHDCGFTDYFFFIKSFKKAHGITPAAYSNQVNTGNDTDHDIR